MFGEPPYPAGRASLLAWRLFPHLAGRARLRLVNESESSVLELARFQLSVFPGLRSCPSNAARMCQASFKPITIIIITTAEDVTLMCWLLCMCSCMRACVNA